MDTLEKSKEIARMLGYEYHPSEAGNTNVIAGWHKIPEGKFYHPKMCDGIGSAYLCRSHNGLQFTSNWNWIMYAVAWLQKNPIPSSDDTLSSWFNLQEALNTANIMLALESVYEFSQYHLKYRNERATSTAGSVQ